MQTADYKTNQEIRKNWFFSCSASTQQNIFCFGIQCQPSWIGSLPKVYQPTPIIHVVNLVLWNTHRNGKEIGISRIAFEFLRREATRCWLMMPARDLHRDCDLNIEHRGLNGATRAILLASKRSHRELAAQKQPTNAAFFALEPRPVSCPWWCDFQWPPHTSNMSHNCTKPSMNSGTIPHECLVVRLLFCPGMSGRSNHIHKSWQGKVDHHLCPCFQRLPYKRSMDSSMCSKTSPYLCNSRVDFYANSALWGWLWSDVECSKWSAQKRWNDLFVMTELIRFSPIVCAMAKFSVRIILAFNRTNDDSITLDSYASIALQIGPSCSFSFYYSRYYCS